MPRAGENAAAVLFTVRYIYYARRFVYVQHNNIRNALYHNVLYNNASETV